MKLGCAGPLVDDKIINHPTCTTRVGQKYDYRDRVIDVVTTGRTEKKKTNFRKPPTTNRDVLLCNSDSPMNLGHVPRETITVTHDVGVAGVR